MSRIERAIEKASRARESGPGINAVAAPESRNRDIDRLLEVEPIRVDNPYLTTLQKGPNGATEEYRKLKSLILKLTAKGQAAGNTLMVTSTVGGEGKTITAINLAVALAQEYDHSVLLVDADLRKPSVHEYLGITPKTGLVQCLRDNAPIEPALVKTGLGKLVVLPAGGTVSDPVERLSSNRMKAIIRELKSRYPERYVIFDAPPALPFAEAAVLGSEVDGVIFVVRERHAKLNDVRGALDSLRGVNLMGVVYNDTTHLNSKGRYYY